MAILAFDRKPNVAVAFGSHSNRDPPFAMSLAAVADGRP